MTDQEEKLNNLSVQDEEQDFTLEEIMSEFRTEQVLSDTHKERKPEPAIIDNPYVDEEAESEPVEPVQSEDDLDVEFPENDSAAKETVEEEIIPEREDLDSVEKDQGWQNPSEEIQDEVSDEQAEDTSFEDVEESEKTYEVVEDTTDDEIISEDLDEESEEKDGVVLQFKRSRTQKSGPSLKERLGLLLTAIKEKRKKEETEEPTAVEASREQRLIYEKASVGCRGIFVPLILLIYLTFAHWINLPLPSFLKYTEKPYVFLFVCLILHVLCLYCARDLIIQGWKDLVSLHLSVETMILFSNAATVIHVLTIMVFPSWGGFLPYTAAACFLLFVGMWARSDAARGRFISLRIASSQNLHTMTRQSKVYGEDDALIKRHEDETAGYVNSVLEPDSIHRVIGKLSPLIILIVLILSAVASFGQGEPQTFFWCLSAISTAAAGTTALGGALPYLRMARRMKTFGVAVGGGDAIRDLAKPAAMILQDQDLFPTGCVSFNGMKLFHGYDVQRVVTYAYNLMEASGNHIAPLFKNVVKGAFIPQKNVEELSFFETGGVSGLIDGDRVLVGNQNFMKRSGVHLPNNISVDAAVLVAFNYEIAAVFAVNYTAAGSVARILPQLTESDVDLILATRDFNITPELLMRKYRVDQRHLEMPPVDQRVELSDENVIMEGKPLAVFVSDGLAAYAESIYTARRERKVCRFNLAFGIISSILGLILMGFMTAAGAYASASPCNLIIYQVLWTVPYLITSGYIGR